LSIGGWTYSSNFKSCNSAAGRSTFAKSAVHLLKERGFDGIDIDWEYPKDSNEAQSLVDLLQEVRSELDAYANTLATKPHFLLTIAAPAGPQNYEKLKIKEMGKLLDFVNLMAYDYAG
jgi:chitinase